MPIQQVMVPGRKDQHSCTQRVTQRAPHEHAPDTALLNSVKKATSVCVCVCVCLHKPLRNRGIIVLKYI